MSRSSAGCADKLAALQAEFDAYKEGSEQAFGDIVEQKQALERRVEELSRMLVTRGEDLAVLHRKLAVMSQAHQPPAM